MSGPLPCDNHLDRSAIVLMTNLEAGDTLTLCAECYVEWCVFVAKGPDQVPEITQAELEATEEVATLEPEPPAPDASGKSEPEPAPTPAPKPTRSATPAPETPAPGE